MPVRLWKPCQASPPAVCTPLHASCSAAPPSPPIQKACPQSALQWAEFMASKLCCRYQGVDRRLVCLQGHHLHHDRLAKEKYSGRRTQFPVLHAVFISFMMSMIGYLKCKGLLTGELHSQLIFCCKLLYPPISPNSTVVDQLTQKLNLVRMLWPSFAGKPKS